jgi:hypothetical protein
VRMVVSAERMRRCIGGWVGNRREAIENIIDAEPVAAMCASSWPTERNGREAHPTFCRSASILAAML